MSTCIEANRAGPSRDLGSGGRHQTSGGGGTSVQELAIFLDGITADDFLTWCATRNRARSVAT